jgi:hypothetical protein
MWPRLFTSHTAIFFMGAASVAVLKAMAPLLGSVGRPLLREAIKGGLLLKREIQTVVEEAWQDVEDITAEAQAEIEREQHGNEKAS